MRIELDYHYDKGGMLECVGEYTPPERGHPDNGPNYPAEVTLIAATACGMDVLELLSDDTVREIEEAMLEMQCQ